jgi:hypothetical protein
MEQENEPLEYSKCILVDGYLKQNPEIRHGINLALKLFHYNSSAVKIFQPKDTITKEARLLMLPHPPLAQMSFSRWIIPTKN